MLLIIPPPSGGGIVSGKRLATRRGGALGSELTPEARNYPAIVSELASRVRFRVIVFLEVTITMGFCLVHWWQQKVVLIVVLLILNPR